MRARSTITVVIVAAAVVASLVVAGAPVEQLVQHTDSEDQQQTYLRVVHASPDAPAVDVLVEGEELLGNVSFGNVSDYMNVTAGTYNVTITAADDPDTVVFNDTVTLEPRNAVTLTASGEISEGANTSFQPVTFEDDAFAPTDNESAVRVVHLVPDAPAVDVTVNTDNGTLVLADNVTFQNASEYVTVPAGNYTVDIRVASEDDNGTVVASVDLSLAGGEAYSAMAVGYVDTEAAPADTPFEVVVTEDARWNVTVPSEETMTNGTATETGTETGMGTETETETGA